MMGIVVILVILWLLGVITKYTAAGYFARYLELLTNPADNGRNAAHHARSFFQFSRQCRAICSWSGLSSCSIR